MESSMFPALAPFARRAAPYIAAVVIGGAGLGYAVHERHNAQTLTLQNQQETAQLNATQSQLGVLTARVNALAASNLAKPSPETYATRTSTERIRTERRSARRRPGAEDLRFNKLQSEVDAQGKEIDETRNDLASARTELGGSIARTHDELVVLEKKGARNYYEFDIVKSREFKREGPLSLRLKKANNRRQFADLVLIVDDRNLTQKHVNLYQPVMFYEPGSPQPVEVVINEISKNHIHGYVSAPKYSQAELAAADTGANPGPGANQAANAGAQPAHRQVLTVPPEELNQP